MSDMTNVIANSVPLHTRSVSNATSTGTQRKIAWVVGSVLILVFLVTLPFSKQPGTVIPPFFPSFIAVSSMSDLLTAYLLYSQFLVGKNRSIAVLASVYLFSGLITIPHFLTFPGVFTTNGLLGANKETAVYLWVFWHAGFALGILWYLITELRAHKKSRYYKGSTGIYLVRQITTLITIVIAITYVAMKCTAYLPLIIQQGNYHILWTSGVGQIVLLINVLCVLGLLFFQRSNITIIQLWLKLAALSSLLDVALTLAASIRYSVGWYLARMNSLLAATIVLIAMLYEINRLYYLMARQQSEIAYLAYHDTLTGLPNRRRIVDLINGALELNRIDGTTGAILLFDLDGFKHVNDTWGHDIGDELLKWVAVTVQGCLSPEDSFARLGGDEFIILTRLANAAESIAQKVIDVIRQPIKINQAYIQVSASVGISQYPQDGQDIRTLLKESDIAMYYAKTNGKNQYYFARTNGN